MEQASRPAALGDHSAPDLRAELSWPDQWTAKRSSQSRPCRMKNPPLIAARCFAAWWALRKFPGVFSVRDATRDIGDVLRPGRFTERALRQFIASDLEIKPLPDGVQELKLRDPGLTFYWRGEISGGLVNAVLQEINPEHPHCYTTDPVRLSASSRVLDVGACEGLFAFRVLTAGQA